METIKKYWMWAAILAALIVAWVYWSGNAFAADLGGNCCSDLEERIAELEATTATKGNRKVSLTVSGQVNKSILYWDALDESNTGIIENSASESYVGFYGKAAISKDWNAGFVLEIGQGKTGINALATSINNVITTDNDLYTRQSFVWLGNEYVRVSVGLQNMATYGIAEANTAHTDAAIKALTIQPIGVVLLPLGGSLSLEPFNGVRADAVRLDVTPIKNFTVSAAWSSSVGLDLGVVQVVDDAWDIAARYAGEFSGFKMVAGVGFAHTGVDPFILVGGGEADKITGSASVMHIASGVFLTGAYGRIDVTGGNTDAYHVQGGIEQNFFGIGPTTLFAEYASWDDLDLDWVGLGVNQSLAGTAVDLYISGRRYGLGDEDATTVLGGARVKF